MPATYDNLATTTLSSATPSISFNSISTAYTDLVLVSEIYGSTGDVYLRFNGVTNVTCNTFRANGDKSSNSKTQLQGQNYIALNPFYQLGLNTKLTSHVDIMGYRQGIQKGVLIRGAWYTSGGESSIVTYGAGMWQSTNAITSLTISSSSGNLNAGSVFTLYGIAKA